MQGFFYYFKWCQLEFLKNTKLFSLKSLKVKAVIVKYTWPKEDKMKKRQNENEQLQALCFFILCHIFFWCLLVCYVQEAYAWQGADQKDDVKPTVIKVKLQISQHLCDDHSEINAKVKQLQWHTIAFVCSSFTVKSKHTHKLKTSDYKRD